MTRIINKINKLNFLARYSFSLSFVRCSTDYSLRDNIWLESFPQLTVQRFHKGLVRWTHVLFRTFYFGSFAALVPLSLCLCFAFTLSQSHSLSLSFSVGVFAVSHNRIGIRKARKFYCTYSIMKIVMTLCQNTWKHSAFKSIEINFNDYFELYRNNISVCARNKPFGVYSHVFFRPLCRCLI